MRTKKIFLILIGIITGIVIFYGFVVYARNGLWYPSVENIRPVSNSWGLRIPALTNCDTIDTDANGIFSCGTDATGIPAGSDGQIQYNDGGNFGGTTGFTWDSNELVPLLSTIIADTAALSTVINKEYVDLAVTSLGATYYMYDENDATGYKTCYLNPSSDAETYLEAANLANNDYIGGWISASGEAPTKLLKGIYDWYVTIEKTTGTQTLRVYWQLVERKSDSSEIVIATSSDSNEINDRASYIVPLQLTSDYIPDTGSRIVGKLYADISGSGNAPTARLYYQGNTSSRWEIPANSEIFQNIFVPYSGATSNVDLGSYDLTTAGDIKINSDNKKIFFGAGDDASIYYDGTNLQINPKEAGSGYLHILGNIAVEGTTNQLTLTRTPEDKSCRISVNSGGDASLSCDGNDITTSSTFFTSNNMGIGATGKYLQIGTSSYKCEMETDSSQFVIDTSKGINDIDLVLEAGTADIIADGTLKFASGSIIDTTGAISFDNENLSTTGNIYNAADNSKHFFGAGNDASIYYSGSHMYINPKEVGDGFLYVLGDIRPTALTVAYFTFQSVNEYLYMYNQGYHNSKGMLMYGYTPGRSKLTLGQKGYNDATFSLGADTDDDNLLIRRKWDGASTYSEAGALLKLERVITNVIAENGNYIEADDKFVIDKDGRLGIGDMSPDSVLEVVSSGDDYFMLSSTAEADGNILIVDSAGDLTVAGKATFSGGVDPPYVSYSGETYETIREYAKKVNPDQEVMQFWNKETRRMEIYVIKEDRFYAMSGELVEDKKHNWLVSLLIKLFE